jgi:uncharacterized protein (DUF305 family)
MTETIERDPELLDDVPSRASSLTWPKVLILLLAFSLFAGFLGYRIGQPSKADLNDVDIGFLADMTTHHEGAIALSFHYLARQDDRVVTFIAQGIVRAQSQEISFMNSRLLDASDSDRVQAIVNDDVAMDWMGHPVIPRDMPGLATQADFDELDASSGVTADDVFTRLMINHHAAGVEMAEHVIANGKDEVVRRFARKMATNQRNEIAEMNGRRAALGLERVTPQVFAH